MPYGKLKFPGPKPRFTNAMKAKIAMEVVTGKISCLTAGKTYKTAPGIFITGFGTIINLLINPLHRI